LRRLCVFDVSSVLAMVISLEGGCGQVLGGACFAVGHRCPNQICWI
jgi:hypothetical protein